MSIDRDELKHIALLSRLELTDAEAELYTQHVGEILNYIEKLQELDVTDIEETTHTVPIHSVMRDDEAKPGLEIDEALKNTSDRHERYFRVPRVTE